MKKPFFPFILLAFSLVLFSFNTPPSVKSRSKAKKSSLTFPVAGNKSRIKDKWGARRAGGIRKHKGIDIHARKGTPVVAITDGVIVDRDHTPIGGKTLWLRSSNNDWKAYYAHLDKQLVKEGQTVRKGQVIGTVGNTGNARTTPSHLHFGVSKDNKWVDPLPYVKHAPKLAVAKSKKTTHTKKTRRTKKSRR